MNCYPEISFCMCGFEENDCRFGPQRLNDCSTNPSKYSNKTTLYPEDITFRTCPLLTGGTIFNIAIVPVTCILLTPFATLVKCFSCE